MASPLILLRIEFCHCPCFCAGIWLPCKDVVHNVHGEGKRAVRLCIFMFRLNCFGIGRWLSCLEEQDDADNFLVDDTSTHDILVEESKTR